MSLLSIVNRLSFVLRRLVQNNYIQTSKYTLLSFVPVNLIEQFQRLANFYFLCLLVLQFIPFISSLTPVTTAVPLIGVLLLTAIKDAYDDFVSCSSFGLSVERAESIILCLVFVDCSKDIEATRRSTTESRTSCATASRWRSAGTKSRWATLSAWRTTNSSLPTCSS